MITKQEYLLSVPFEYILGFSKETKLIRSNGCFTKKDFVQRLIASLEIAECKQIYEDYKNGESYKRSVNWFLTKFPTGQFIGKSFVENQNNFAQKNFFFEFPISKTRVDILHLLNSFHAYEIKSQRDKLNRLNYQIPALRQFFENVSLIIPSASCSEVMKTIDEKIGIITFLPEDNKISFEVARESTPMGEYNPTAQLNILQISELRDIYFHNIGPVTKKLGRSDLIEKVVNRLPFSQINDLFKQTIRKRTKIGNQQDLFENQTLD